MTKEYWDLVDDRKHIDDDVWKKTSMDKVKDGSTLIRLPFSDKHYMVVPPSINTCSIAVKYYCELCNSIFWTLNDSNVHIRPIHCCYCDNQNLQYDRNRNNTEYWIKHTVSGELNGRTS
jgi:hypothetical protein